MTVKISRFTQSKFVNNDSGPEGHLLNVHGGSLWEKFGGVVLRLQGDPWDDLVDSWDLRFVVRFRGRRWSRAVDRLSRPGLPAGVLPGSRWVAVRPHLRWRP